MTHRYETLTMHETRIVAATPPPADRSILTLINMMTNDGKRAVVQLTSVRLT